MAVVLIGGHHERAGVRKPRKTSGGEGVTEEIIEPDLPICDPHHHLWDFPNGRYLLDELLADIAATPLTNSVSPTGDISALASALYIAPHSTKTVLSTR